MQTKRRLTPISAVRWLEDGSGTYISHDPDTSIDVVVNALNGELFKGLAEDAQQLQWQHHTQHVLELLRAGLAGIAAFGVEEGRIYLSPGYPDPDDFSALRQWLDAMEDARRAEYASLRAIDELNAFLREYEVTLSLEPSVSKDGEHVSWRLGEEFRLRNKEGGAMEGCLFEVLITLARLGVLDRIRQCACGKWFFAQRGNQRSHIPQCRKEKYEAKRPKEKRAGYMRWYYAMYQSPNAPRKKVSFEQWLKAQQLQKQLGKVK